MRGALGADRDDGLLQGIIPADAGSTAVASLSLMPMADHPRGCGEHVSTSLLMLLP